MLQTEAPLLLPQRSTDTRSPSGRRVRLGPLAAAGLGWSLVGMVGGAWAQEPSGFDAHGFHLAPFDADLRDGLSVIRPGDFESGDFFAGGVMEYAKAPLVAIRDGQRTAVVDDVLALNVSAGMALHERARLVVGAPVYLAVTGQEQVGGAIGDVRLGSTFVLVRPSDASGIGVGLSPWFDVPTGPDERFLGTGAAAGGVVAALTAERDSLTLTANAGPRFKPQLERANLTGIVCGGEGVRRCSATAFLEVSGPVFF